MYAFVSSTTTLADEIASGHGLTTTVIARQQHVSPPTVFRWVVRGLPDGVGGRIHLEAIRRGKKWLTSHGAVVRFFAALPANRPVGTSPRSPLPRPRPEHRRRADDEHAAARLKELGL